MPGHLVRYADFILRLIDRNSNLEGNGANPFGNRSPGLLRDRTRGFRKLIFAASAFFYSIFLPKPPDKRMTNVDISFHAAREFHEEDCDIHARSQNSIDNRKESCTWIILFQAYSWSLLRDNYQKLFAKGKSSRDECV